MYQKTYYVDKSTQTLADPLQVYGLAEILNHILRGAGIKGKDIFLRDAGHCYTVELSQPLQEVWVDNMPYFNDVSYIQKPEKLDKDGKPKKTVVLRPGIKLIDYEAEKSKREKWFELREQLKKAKDDHAQLETEVQQYKPHANLDIWIKINQMSAITAYNDMVRAWDEARVCFPEVLKIILRLHATTPNDVAGALEAWKKCAKQYNLTAKPMQTATQVYNPATGKGSNRPKADALTIGGQENFWLIEWLKAIGMEQAGIPRIVSKAKDRKTYVLIPKNIKLGTSKTIFEIFRQQLWASSAIKMDIMASLQYTRIFLQQWSSGQLTERDLAFGRKPGNYVQGLAVAFYKDMGSAFALMNQSVINFPDWLREVKTKEEASLFFELVEEHERVIRVFDEQHGHDNQLLRTYRDFLSSGDLQDFFAFTGSYSSYLMHRPQNQRNKPKQFTIKNLKELIMAKNQDLTPIVNNESFQRIATAIRHSTILLQYYRYQHESAEKLYDIRYGLGQELMRKGQYSEDFLKALSDFLVKYSNENAMVEEHAARSKDKIRKRPKVQSTDIGEIVRLVKEYKDSQLICSMLVAFGYATDYTKKEDNKINPDNQPTGDSNNE